MRFLTERKVPTGHMVVDTQCLQCTMHMLHQMQNQTSNLYLVQYADLHMQFGEFNMHFWLYMGILG